MDRLRLPEGAVNEYANHPGFDAQGCPVQYTVHPQNLTATYYGFGCRWTGGHCKPGPHCDKRREEWESSQSGDKHE